MLEVDYSLFIMETVEKSLEKMETKIGVSVFLRRSFQRTSGVSFISGFRSKPSRWKKDRRQRSSEAQKEGSHAAHVPGRVGPPILALGSPLVCFLRSQVFFLPKNDAPKFAGDLDDVWVPETLKYKTRVFCLCRVNSIKIGNH